MTSPIEAPNDRTSIGRAAGKVILLGEHAVVYGAPGLAAGIERGVTAALTLTEARVAGDEAIHMRLGDRDVAPRADGDDLERALHALTYASPLPERARGGFTVSVTTEIAPGGGLGCSAAIGVAVARAIEAFANDAGTGERALARATAWEGVFHGNPSGIDTAAAFSGGFLRFVRGEGATPIESPHDLHFAVGYSGSSASTKEMVAGVARVREKNPVQVEKFLEAVRSLVKNAELAIQANDIGAIGDFLDLNQMLLAGLMLSTEAIEDMRNIAKGAGARGAKLTGSGGGGSVIAITETPEIAARVVTAWSDQGYAGFATKVGARKATTS